EFAILGVAALATISRFVLQLIDMQVEGTWHAKSTISLVVEFVTEVKEVKLRLGLRLRL
ncbi:unnamed protein product, partial [Discosporangium mesarthrocarpum]